VGGGRYVGFEPLPVVEFEPEVNARLNALGVLSNALNAANAFNAFNA